jgi:hypothetical protein
MRRRQFIRGCRPQCADRLPLGASNCDPERMRKGAVELVALAPDVVLACQRCPTEQGCRSRIKSFRGFQLKQGGYL